MNLRLLLFSFALAMASARSVAGAPDPALWTPTDVGAPAIAGGTLVTNQTVEVTAGGTGIGPRGDQFHFVGGEYAQDFDLKVRVAALKNTDVLAKAGLMMRESLDPAAPFAGVFASPSAAGRHFQSRSSPAAATTQLGNVIPNIPYGWLRLRRVGDVITGFAGEDGLHWSVLGSNTISMSTVLVGFAVTSRSTNQPTKAVFADFAEVGVNDSLAPAVTVVEPPGPTSRRTAMVISEIMYHPPVRSDGRNLEFVEIYNSQPFFEDLSGWKLTGDYDFTFPAGTVISGGGFLLVAPSPGDLTAVYGLTNVVGGFTNTLSHSSGSVNLLSAAGAVYLEVSYRDKSPWPLAPDGAGHSLALVRPSLGERNPHAWGASAALGGSPGAWEYVDPNPLRTVVINEVMARPAPGGASEPFIELYNRGQAAASLAGCRLGYGSPTTDYAFPDGIQIAPGGFVLVSQSQLRFQLRVDAEALFLRAPTGKVIDAVRFAPTRAGVSRGRFADGAELDFALSTPTPGRPNATPTRGDLVLNEIMYDPISGDKDLEYVELYNSSNQAQSLSGWRLSDGVDYTFPSQAAIGPGAYLVVARNTARLREVYSHLTDNNCLGNFQGGLSSRGERLALERPEVIVDALGQSRTIFVPVSEVTYGTGGQWGQWSAEGGSSLELKDARADTSYPANWGDSDETAKGQWTTIESTGVLDLGAEVADSLHVGLLGEGECLIDNIEVIGPGGTNLVINGSFEEDTVGFAVLGNHVRSSLETTEGDQSSKSLHIRASGNMDTGANRIRFRLTKSLAPGDTATLRARVRWLKGWPEVLLRLHGNWLEAVGRAEVPLALGTPAKPNSRATANVGPAVSHVDQWPILPAVGEPLVVSVRAADPDGVASVVLHWRLDPSAEDTVVPMRDDGTGGDVVAGDGLFSATIPGQAAGGLVAFYVEATDGAATPATSVLPAGAPDHECLSRWGEPATGNAFGAYRLWLTQKAVTTWRSRPNLSNEPVEGTLVYGSFRVIHGVGGRYSGSPYHQQFSSPLGECHYVWKMPGDDLLLGTDNFNKIHGPGNGPFDDDTIQREQTVFWMGRQIGLPWLYRRYVNVFVNGSRRRSLMEDTQVPGGDMVNSYFPDDADGALYKINPWFEFQAGTGTSMGFNNESWADMNLYVTSGGEKKKARYRWNWQPRAANGTADDYGPIFELVDTANTQSQEGFIDGMSSLVNMEQWLKTFALNHAVGNWDSFGNQNAQNMYGYKPDNGPWHLFMWDVNIVLGNAGFSDGPTGDDLFKYNFSDAPMGRIYNTPEFRRMYLRFLREIARGPMQADRVGAVIDSKVAAFQAAGVNNGTGSSIKNWIKTRVTYLESQVNAFQAPFAAAPDGLTGGATSQNLITISGTAPLEVTRIRINGVEVPVRWTSESAWTASVVLSDVLTRFRVDGLDKNGQVFPGTVRTFTVRFTGKLERAQDKIVFSEIQYHPTVPGAEYVELFNSSTSSAFDCSNWRVSGLGYTFPAGSLMAPGQRFLLAANRAVFAQVYDPSRSIPNDYFPGTLSPQGETLRLIQPGATPDLDEVITAVTYSASDPWPSEAAGTGAALQLIDARRGEDERVGNWGIVPVRDPNAVTWKFATMTGTAGTSTNLQLYLSGDPVVTDPMDAVGTFWGTITFGTTPARYGVSLYRQNGVLNADFLYDPNDPSKRGPMVNVSQNGLDVRFGFDAQNRFVGKLAADGSKITGSYLNPGASAPFSFSRQNPGGEVFLDDLSLVEGGVPELGSNLIQNGDFETLFSSSWMANGAHSESGVSAKYAHGGTQALRLVATTGGTGSDTNAVLQILSPLTNGQTYTLSFWYLSSTNGESIVARLGDGALQTVAKLDPPKDPHNEWTPGFQNTTAAELPPFPDVWLNEILPNPRNGAPFVELHNHGTNTLNLGGLYLSDTRSNPVRDALPASGEVAPGGFLVISLDGKGTLTDPANLHASFVPTGASGLIYLTRVSGTFTNLVDFLRWNGGEVGRSFGHFPDGSPHDDRSFAIPTPGASNTLAVPNLPIVINEWMASNHRIADPAGGPNSQEFDDWFELYNPNPQAVNLAGYSLTDLLSNPTQFRIPNGYSIPGKGFLLVWADNQTKQNTNTSPDLHVNFKLSADGEAIGLFAPDGTMVDSVTFGPQVAEVSEGRPADGAPGPFVPFIHPSPGGMNAAVLPPPPVLAVSSLDEQGQPLLQWNSIPGRAYQLRSRDSLDAPWENVGNAAVALDTISYLPDNRPATTTRFYQIIFVP